MKRTESLRVHHYVCSFLLTVMVALLLLYISCFLPQAPILDNLSISVGGLRSEGLRPNTFDHQQSGSLDTYTDTEMLRATASTHSGNILSVLTNDFYKYEEAESNIDNLKLYASGAEPDGVYHYTRYWMGFRVFLRLGLVFLNYFQIRRYLGLAFFCIFIALIFQIEKYTDKKLAYLFAFSILLVRPHVIASLLQYSCCFFIAFIAMLFVPWLRRHPKFEALFFMEIGMITMYFDFYTVPLVTFGLPLIYLLVLQTVDHQTISLKRIFKLLAMWFFGWVFMWIAKLVLTSLFTEVNAVENGISSFFSRVGIVKNPQYLQYYSIPYAFSELFKTIFCDLEGAVIYLSGVLVCFTAIIVRAVQTKTPWNRFRKYSYFLVIAAVPVVWFTVTAQPIAIHAFFQYRSIAVIYWSFAAYIYMVFNTQKGMESRSPNAL